MRRLFLIFTLIINVDFLMGCSNQEKRMKDLWKFEESINYQQFTKSEKEKIDKLLKSFFLEEKYNKYFWNSGYSQQCYVLRKLYYEEIISKEYFLNQCVSIYERYEANQKNISFHTVGHAVCLYYLGQTEKARDMFIEIAKSASEEEFSSKSDYELSLFVCKKLLHVSNESCTETFYSKITDEDIINTFCGN